MSAAVDAVPFDQGRVLLDRVTSPFGSLPENPGRPGTASEKFVTEMPL